MKKLFGTDGVRGVANKELTGELAYKLGRAGGYYLIDIYQKYKENSSSQQKPVILIGKDTRVSGDMLESALIAGLTSCGIDAYSLGVIPTPGVAYLTRELEVQGSIMISASHNPIADNGIKFFDNNGYKLTDNMEKEIENIIYNKFEEIPAPTHEKIGNFQAKKSYKEKYINHLLQSVRRDFTDMKVVLDCAHGAAYRTAPAVLEKLEAETVVLNNKADGEKINVKSGSTYPGPVQEKVQETKADIGIAHDGDADRVILVDEKGNIVNGDQIMAILALNMLKQNRLKNKTLVTTRYSNLGLKEVLEKEGADFITVKNGDRYVLQEMLKNDYNLGGEQSGHIILLDYNTTGDGILAALKIMEIMKDTEKSLSSLAAVMEKWPQKLTSIEVENKEDWEENKKISKVIKNAEEDLGQKGRVFVRASGTEPVIRVMVESKNRDKLKKWKENLVKVIDSELN